MVSNSFFIKMTAPKIQHPMMYCSYLSFQVLLLKTGTTSSCLFNFSYLLIRIPGSGKNKKSIPGYNKQYLCAPTFQVNTDNILEQICTDLIFKGPFILFLYFFPSRDLPFLSQGSDSICTGMIVYIEMQKTFLVNFQESPLKVKYRESLEKEMTITSIKLKSFKCLLSKVTLPRYFSRNVVYKHYY